MAAGALAQDFDGGGVAGWVRARPLAVALGLLVVLAVTLVVGVGLGSVSIPPAETLGIVIRRTLGITLPIAWSDATETIVWDLRLPRVLTAMLVGAGLAVAGATFQGLLRNPLADPFVLGTSAGAALGAAVAVLLPVQILLVAFSLLHGLAFVGALGAAWLVLRLGGSGGPGALTRLLLTGYAVASVLTAFLTLAMYVSGSDLQQIFGFLLGGLGGSSWARLLVAAPLIIGAIVLILARARVLDGMLLGDAAATHLGIDVRRQRGLLVAFASMATAAGVAIAGLIGFVGLVVPHVVRLVVGPTAGRVIPISALAGAALLAIADLVARLAGDIPVGVVMALVGAPFFLLLLSRSRTRYEL